MGGFFDSLYLWGIETFALRHHIQNRTECEAYLWGIETVVTQCHPSSPSRCEAYLWGIETAFAPFLSTCAPAVRSLPMRNWNWQKVIQMQHMVLVRSLPMRNWNLSLGHLQTWPGWVRSLPMRNWNTFSRASSSSSSWCEAYLWGIETNNSGDFGDADVWSAKPTYEELKPSFLCLSSEAIVRAKPTYEELKRVKFSVPWAVYPRAKPLSVRL